MQTLWTRVAQVRGSCRCPQCLSTANGVSRRATGTATRRAPRYLTSSTLWYSGIFAAAATFDAGVKKDRRERWDRAIADVKQELEQNINIPRTQHADEVEAVTTDLVFTKTQFRPFGSATETGDEFRYVDPMAARPYWPASTGQPLRLDHLPPESIYATSFRRRRLDVTPLSAKKLATVEVSIEILLSDIFLEMERRGWSSDAAKAVPEEFSKAFLLDETELASALESKRASLTKLKQTDKMEFEQAPWQLETERLCHYSRDVENLERSNQSIRDLNSSLLQLFRLYMRDELDKPSLLGKLTCNISRCMGPPNLKTFNTLMIGFSAMDEPELVDKVVKSTRAAKMRPNEVTLATILRHYTKTDRPELFVRWVETMRGKYGGLALARPDIEITKGGQSRLMRKPGNPDKILQLPHATPFVFGPLVEGVVKFAGFETALGICQNMGLEGWGLCMSGLTPLLNDCAERADWTSGLAIWNQIQALKAISRRKKATGWSSERIKLDTFAAMLRLCCRCDERERFDSIWSTAVKMHEHSVDKLVRLVKDGPEQEVHKDALDAAGHDVDTERRFVNSDGDDSLSQTEESIDIRPDPGSLHQVQSFDYQQQKQAPFELVHELSKKLPKVDEISSNARAQDWTRDSTFKPSSAELKSKSKTKIPLPKFAPDTSELLEEQLWGLLPPGDDLDSYELRERPMNVIS